MPSDQDIIIINGRLRRWLSYRVVFGGKTSGEYGSEIYGGLRIRGIWIVLASLIAGFAAGLAL